MDAAKLMDIFNAQTGTVNTLWNIFAAVSLGVLGFALKEKDLRDNWKLKVALTVAFIMFAIGNLDAISRSQGILVAISGTLHDLAPTHQYGAVLKAHVAPSVADIRLGHHVITALVVSVMWIPDIVVRLQRKDRTEEEANA